MAKHKATTYINKFIQMDALTYPVCNRANLLSF